MKQEVEVLNTNDTWIPSTHHTRKSWANIYPYAILVAISDKYYYYYAVKSRLLHRIPNSIPVPQKMTKEQAEKKYNIEITD